MEGPKPFVRQLRSARAPRVRVLLLLVLSFDIDELELSVPVRFGDVAPVPVLEDGLEDMPDPEVDELEPDMPEPEDVPELGDGVVLEEPLEVEPLLMPELVPEGAVVDGPVAEEPVPDVAAPPVLAEPPVPDVPVLVVDEPVPALGLAPDVPLLLDPLDCAVAMPAPTARDTAAASARSRGYLLMMSVPVQVQEMTVIRPGCPLQRAALIEGAP